MKDDWVKDDRMKDDRVKDNRLKDDRVKDYRMKDDRVKDDRVKDLFFASSESTLVQTPQHLSRLRVQSTNQELHTLKILSAPLIKRRSNGRWHENRQRITVAE